MRAALLSVSDQRGLVEFAQGLLRAGFRLLATDGTARALREANIECTAVGDYTGQPEILDGRVKTLHPRIHAGILARRDKAEHMRELETQEILPIDVVAVNLYPFIQALARGEGHDPARMTEFIDIGGPTMIRAAAKNSAFVLPVIDPADYPAVLEFIGADEPAEHGRALRARLASKVFTSMAAYDLAIARYLGTVAEGAEPGSPLGPVEGVVLERAQPLRYGENPHQKASYYRPAGTAPEAGWRQLGGKELSYNNFVDTDAAFRILAALPAGKTAAVIVKHTNPCGVAVRDTLLEAVRAAKRCDPRSHFGGVLAFSGEVTADVAAEVREDFAEIVVARKFHPESLTVLRTSKALRIIEMSDAAAVHEMRSAMGGLLVQEPDSSSSGSADWQVAAGSKPSAELVAELELAWSICAGVKSNAIVLVKDGMLVGAGAGQMSRIDSVELAISKARTHGHDLQGAVAASDAFFPFTDNVETLAAAGIKAIVTPGGAKRDAEVAAAAEKAGVTLLFAPDRHFRH